MYVFTPLPPLIIPSCPIATFPYPPVLNDTFRRLGVCVVSLIKLMVGAPVVPAPPYN